MTGVFVAVSVLASLPFLWILARRPVLRRLAFRNATRRPREATLVVVGSMLGATIITGSFVVGDAMNASIRQIAHEHLGPVDELVLARDESAWQELSTRLAKLPRADVDGVLPFATMDAAVTSYKKGRIVSAPRSQILRVDFTAARTFGGDPHATGVWGKDPDGSHAAISADLARILDVRPGDVVYVTAYGSRSTFLIDRIFPRRGIAGFNVGEAGDQQESRNVILPASSFDAIRGKLSPFAAPPSWAVLVSNRGGVEDGVHSTAAVDAQIRQTAAGLEPQIVDIKQIVLDQAEASGKGFTQMFSTMGSFGILAGLLLLVQLFVMLAAERKPELGMARAVGMRRASLVGGFATEGWLYALVASTLGLLSGLGLGWTLVAVSKQIFNTDHNQFNLFFVVNPRSLAEAFAISFLIALVTVLATSARVSRLNIIRAIREIPEPPPRRKRRWLVAGGLLAALGLVWTASALANTEPFGLMLGPTFFLFGLAPILARVAPARTTTSLLASIVIVWEAVVLAVFPDAAEGASVTIYVLQGIVLTSAAVVLVTLQQERIRRFAKRLGMRGLSTRLGLAYPLARPARTGLTVAMYALVVFILTFITTISHLIDSNAETAKADVRGGFAAVVSSSAANPVQAGRLAALGGVRAVAPLPRISGNFTVAGMTKAAPWHLSAFDERLVAQGAPRLEDRGGYRSDAAAWRAVLTNPNLVIVDPAFLQTGGGPPNFKAEIGTRINLEDPLSGRTRVLRVAAIAPSDMYIMNGAFYGVHGAERLFGDRLVPNRFYVALDRGVDAAAFASSVQGRFIDNGTEASSIDELMDEAFTMSNQIFQLFEGYLALGLLVGIAGIAVVMIRAVRERRRQIGTLRAIGFGSRTVGRSFAIETGFIALEGTVIGASLALVTLYTLVTRSDAMGTSAFSVPWVPLLALLLGTVAASLLATVAPAVSAARIRPAVALRTTD
jgi:putative ABC transport system permease protein